LTLIFIGLKWRKRGELFFAILGYLCRGFAIEREITLREMPRLGVEQRCSLVYVPEYGRDPAVV